MDDFGVKYIRKDNAQYLIDALKDKYKDIKVNWDSDKLCSINLK